ncbi:MAG: dTDP-4-dehydrorhamnose 3,5-epimerase family protein, partial [Bacteroidota bacterium]|nr:dTDP-4-dehydrorhamnose 3,5-epimerase family protein [Bacteroidota bacterium]
QINHSFTNDAGTVRGMHYQLPPFAEIKLLRCIAGAVFDVVVDLREGSATRLEWFGVELSSVNQKMLYIPEGFAHGFQSLQQGTELIYHHSAVYMPGSEGGLRFDDPLLKITWPAPVKLVSARDRQHPLLDLTFTGIKL